jgi:hypothetical protein
VTSVLEDAIRENSVMGLILNTSQVFENYSLNNKGYFEATFGKATASIIYHMENFEENLPKFFKAYVYVLINDPRYTDFLQKSLSQISLIEFKDSEVPFLAQLPVNAQEGIRATVTGLKNPKNLFSLSKRLFLTSERRSFYSAALTFYCDRLKKYIINASPTYQAFIPYNTADIYEHDWYESSSNSSLCSLDEDGDWDVSSIDEASSLPYQEQMKQLYADFEILSSDGFSKAKAELKNISGTMLYEYLHKYFDALNMVTYSADDKISGLIPFDIILAIDSMQARQVVLDGRGFILAIACLAGINTLEYLNFYIDESEQNIYITSEYSVEREETTIVKNQEFGEGTFNKKVRRSLFARVPIKKENYSTVFEYLWLYKFNKDISIQEILAASTDEDLSSISIPSDFLNQQNILNARQRDFVLRQEDNLIKSNKTGGDFFDEVLTAAEAYIKTYAVTSVDDQGNVFYEPKQDNVGMLYTNSIQNKDYIWKVNEVFWRNNKGITVEEMIAYFVTKGDNYNYRLLSYRILGIDVYLFKDKLLTPLLLKGLLFITEFSINKDLKKIIKPMKLAYKYEYITGSYYEKAVSIREAYKDKPQTIEALEQANTKDVYGSIKLYFTEDEANTIINNHINWLNANKPVRMSLNGSPEMGNLLTPTIFDPLLFNMRDSLGNYNEALQAIFRSFISKKELSLWRGFKAQNENAVSAEDFVELYINRTTISKYITKYLKTNMMYELSALEESGKLYHTLIGKGNGKIIYRSQKSDAVEDFGLEQLAGGVPAFLSVEKYSYKKSKSAGKSVTTAGLRFANIKPGNFANPDVENNRFLSYADLDEERFDYVTYFVPFEKQTYQHLYQCGFISDATWARIKDKEVKVTATKLLPELGKRGLEISNENLKAVSRDFLMTLSEKESRILYQIFFKIYVSKREDATKEGDFQFARHIKSLNSYVDVYEDAWNRVYNDALHPTKEISSIVIENGVSKERKATVLDNSKFPIFLEYSRFFGYDSNEEFALNDSQIDGIKFNISSGNSGLLAHEVGFGKTLAAIGTMYHCIITGEAKRPFISAPVQVYRNFIKEISGEPGVFRGFAPQLPVVRLFNAKPQVFLTYDSKTLEQRGGIKRYNKNQIKLIQDFAKIKKIKTGIISAKYNNLISLKENDDNSFVNFLKDFEAFLDASAPTWKEEPSFQEITFDKFSEIHEILLTEYNNEIKNLNDKFQNKEELLKTTPERVKEYKDLLKLEMSAQKRGTGIYRGKSAAERAMILESRKSDLLEEAEDLMVKNLELDKAEINEEKSTMLASYIRFLITMIPIKVYDAFGWYDPIFLQDGAIVASSHTALAQFEIENHQAVEANLEVGIDKIAAFKLAIRPVSFKKLRCDMIVVDEVHNFNEYYSKAKRVVIKRSVSKAGNDNSWIAFDGGNANSNENDNTVVLRYETAGIKTKETKIVIRKLYERVAKESFARIGKYNTVALSATPFVDNLYQMISVFGMLRPTISVSEFYSSFCYETWGLSMNNRNEIVYVPEISSFKNSIARNNYMKSFCQFYTYDKNIERKRPNKFTFPYISTQDKNNSLYTCYTDTSSTVPLSDVQVKLFENISRFLYGEIKESEIAPLQEPKLEGLVVKKLIEEKELMELWTESLNSGAADVPDVEDWMIKNDILSLDPSAGGGSELKALKLALEEAATKLTDDVTGGPYVVFYKKRKAAESDDDENENDDAVVEEVMGDAMTDKSSKLKYTSLVQQRVALSPYMVLSKENNSKECSLLPSLKGNAESVFAESAKIFIENSPKVLFAVMSAVKTIEYHQSRNEDVSGQIIFMSKTQNFVYGGISYNAFDLIKVYLEVYYGLKKTFTIEVNDDDSDTERTVSVTVSEVEKLTGEVTSSPIKKKAIEKAFNQGLIKILLGSEAIREGLNLQGMNTATTKHGTSTIYVLTPDYAPMVFMQLEGRVWRQGNPLDNVRIVYVLHKNSIDQHVYSRLKIKIAQVKALLEAGIYEAGGTQFTQDIKGVSEFLTTNIEKKIDNRWDEEKQRLQLDITNRNNVIDKINKVAKTYNYARIFVDNCIEYINPMSKFLKMCGVVSGYIKYSKYRHSRTATGEQLYENLNQQLLELKKKYDEERDEKYSNPLKELYDAYVADYKKRKDDYLTEQKAIKEQAKEAKRQKEKEAKEKQKAAEAAGEEKPLSEIMGAASGAPEDKNKPEEQIVIIPFAEEEIGWSDFKKQNNSKFIDVLKDINARKSADMSAAFEVGCEAISVKLQNEPQLAKEYNILNNKVLSANSRIEDIIEAAFALANNGYHWNIDFPAEMTVRVSIANPNNENSWSSTQTVAYDASENIFAAKDLGGQSASEEYKRFTTTPTYSFIYDCMEHDNIFQRSNTLPIRDYVELYSIKTIKDTGFNSVFNNPSYYDGLNRKENYGSHFPSVTLRNILGLLNYGMSPMDTLSLYETLIEAKGLTIADTDKLIKKIQLEKDKFLAEILKEREYRISYRKEYEERKKKEEEERKGLVDMFQVIDFESGKFGNSNKMIYFRAIENLQEVRNSLYEC